MDWWNSVNSVNNMNMSVAILAGGSGTRLWPLSTPSRPKPFVSLGPLGTLYGRTVDRARALGPLSVSVIGMGALRGLCSGAGVRFVEEPAARNTAAAVALAGASAWDQDGPEACLVVLPSDHLIAEVELFHHTLRRLAEACQSERALGVMGIKPTGPETGYGYLEEGPTAGAAFRVARFIEKPDARRAEGLLATGRVSWNSGMFCFPLRVLREEMGEHCPGLWEAAQAWLGDGDPKPYVSQPPISVDYALMEKSRRVIMLPAEFAWSDLGTFRALHASLPRDAHGNSGWGPGRVEECHDCLIITTRPHTLVRALSGQAVVETEAGLLVTPLSQAESIRAGVEAVLKSEMR